MIKLRPIAFLLLLVFSQADVGFAQDFTITGQVIDDELGSPLLGVSIVLRDNLTDQNIPTDSEGKFSFNITDGAEGKMLEFSFIGYRRLNIMNFPIDQEVVNLGTVALYEYVYSSIPLVQFNCDWYQFNCKYHQKKFWEKVADENEKKHVANNLYISSKRYHFRGNEFNYLVDYYKGKPEIITIDLANPN